MTGSEMKSLDVESFAAVIAEHGWAIRPRIIDDSVVAQLRATVAPFATSGRGGVRNLLDFGEIQALATLAPIRRLVSAALGAECFAVRALFFDKTPDANWKVIWHQDLTIATKERAEVADYGPWTEKSSVPHVQPPISVLERMLAIRVHLDPCGIENGPVRVLDGSHRLGRLSADAIDALRRREPQVDCIVEQGGVLAFRPLILHASSPSTAPAHRRVIHIEFATGELNPPLEWHRRVA
jgi:ectoine hydroxylase-related dioxygenase (phytanoyl-CoA dioxygenase family)